MTFAIPILLLFLPVVLAVFVLWLAVTRGSIRRARQYSRKPIARAQYATAFFATAALAITVVAAAQPRWGVEEIELEREGTDILFLLDVSRGMAAQDASPSRFAAARDAILATLDTLEGDRVGLIIFGGSATLRFPMTSDYNAARGVLRVMEPGSIFVEPGTDIAQALDLALSVASPAGDRGRLVVLLSDGEQLGPGNSPAAAGRLADAGIDLLVAGVGTSQGAPIPVFNRQAGEVVLLTTAGGDPVITRLDEPSLLSIARAGQGAYLGADPTLLPGAVRARLATLEAARIDVRSAEVPVERFQWVALAALLLLLLAMWGERLSAAIARLRFALSPALLSLLALAIAACAEESHRLNAEGLDAYARGEYTEAAERFREAERIASADFRLSLNLAAAHYADGHYDRAITAASRATESSSASLRAEAHASVGHSAFAMGDFPAALAAFRSALREDPSPEYRHNYEVMLRLLEPPPAEQPPDDPPGETPANGEPGDNGDPGEPEPEPADDPGDQPGDQPGAPGEPGTLSDVEEAITAIDEAVRDIGSPEGGEFTLEEALEILELHAERARLAALRESLRLGAGSAEDY